MSSPRLIVGLGNPGGEYADNRHNVGFWFIDQLARRLQVPLTPQGKFLGRVGRHEDLWLLQPMTYMNLSGQAVAALAGVETAIVVISLVLVLSVRKKCVYFLKPKKKNI
jgi:PTH1 family peptidyl-tRNA hydrolase